MYIVQDSSDVNMLDSSYEARGMMPIMAVRNTCKQKVHLFWFHHCMIYPICISSSTDCTLSSDFIGI